MDINLEQLKQVHCSDSQDRFFVSTMCRSGHKESRPDGYFITILPYLSDKKNDYNPRDQEHVYLGPKTSKSN